MDGEKLLRKWVDAYEFGNETFEFDECYMMRDVYLATVEHLRKREEMTKVLGGEK